MDNELKDNIDAVMNALWLMSKNICATEGELECAEMSFMTARNIDESIRIMRREFSKARKALWSAKTDLIKRGLIEETEYEKHERESYERDKLDKERWIAGCREERDGQ